MPIYEGRKPKTWRVILCVRGKKHEWIVPGKKRDAERFRAAKLLALDASKKPSKRVSPSFTDFCREVYGPHAVRNLGSNTWTKVRVYQIATLGKHFGKLRLTEFSPEAIEDFKNARDAGASSVNNELRVLRTILNFADEMGYPVAKLVFKKLPTNGARRVHFWTHAQVDALFRSAEKLDPEILPALIFLLNTGCRKGESIACEWSWVDLDGGMLRIPVNDFWKPKSKKPREVPLSRSLLALLERPRLHERWVFPTIHGGRFVEFPKDRFAAVRKAAGLDGGPHTTRHTFASHFLAAPGTDLFLLAQVLGHSHQRVTELYSHLLPGHLSRARDAVDMAPTSPTIEKVADMVAPEVLH